MTGAQVEGATPSRLTVLLAVVIAGLYCVSTLGFFNRPPSALPNSQDVIDDDDASPFAGRRQRDELGGADSSSVNTSTQNSDSEVVGIDNASDVRSVGAAVFSNVRPTGGGPARGFRRRYRRAGPRGRPYWDGFNDSIGIDETPPPAVGGNAYCPAGYLLIPPDSNITTYIDRVVSALNYAVGRFSSRKTALMHVLDHWDELADPMLPPASKGPFLTLEFGVFQGNSMRYTHRSLRQLSKLKYIMAGFDSFEGLPETWYGVYQQGAFGNKWSRRNAGMTVYEAARAAIPDDVELVKGYFNDTLPGYLARFPKNFAALVNNDGDLYSSANTTLTLATPHIGAGTIMYFDELFYYPAYIDHEIKAMWQWAVRENVTLCAVSVRNRLVRDRLTATRSGVEQGTVFRVVSIGSRGHHLFDRHYLKPQKITSTTTPSSP